MAPKSPKSASPYEERQKRLRKALSGIGADSAIISSRHHLRYLTGFTGSRGELVLDRRGAHFITDARYAERVGSNVAGAKVHIIPIKGGRDWMIAFLKGRGYAAMAFEEEISYAAYAALKTTAGKAKVKLVKDSISPAIIELRRIKDAGELRSITKAARLADEMMALGIGAIRAGVTEAEISKLIRRAAEDLGGEGESFTNIVASGPNAAIPHHEPGKRRLRKGDMITIDLGAVVEGYCSDLTRTVVLGKASARFVEIYQVCLASQLAAINACKAGVPCCEIDAASRDLITDHGFGDYFQHGLGHAVGLEIHENPRFNPISDATAKAGEVMTIEPGIYIPGFGGVRIEDLVVVTAGKPKILSKTPKDLMVIPA